MALLLAGCTSGPQKDLPSIAEARSLTAEWALVNEQAAAGQVTATYRDTMRKQLREQIEVTAQALRKSPVATEVQAVLAEPDDASPAALRAHADKLKQIEDRLESA